MTISLAHPEDFGIRAELLDRSRPIEPRLYLYVERELAKSTDSASFFWVLLAAHCLIHITLLRGLSEFIRQYRRPVPIIANLGLGERDPNLPQARFSPAAVTYPITTNQTWELLRFHSKLERSSDEVEDVKDDRPIGPA